MCPKPVGLAAGDLKAALATGQAPQVYKTDPLTVTVSGSATLTGASISNIDPCIRRLGGTWNIISEGFPWALFVEGRSTHYTTDTVTGWSGNTSVLEFVLQGDAFEWSVLGYGNMGGWTVQVDGVFTSAAGYDAGSNGDAVTRWFKVQLPHSDNPRRIRIIYDAKPFGGLRLPEGATLLDPAPKAPSSVVYIGDSITEGSVATQAWRRWAVQSSLRLGIDDYILSGVGSSGYLNHGRGPYFTFRERIEDVLTAVNGGPPDMAVIAGGINDTGVYTPDQIGAEALAYFQALRAGAPNMKIVVLGPFAGYGGYGDGSQLPQVRDAIAAAAKQVSGTYFVDVTDWVTPDNRDTIFRAQGADGPHPTDAGHMIYGQKAAAAISSIIAGP